MKKKYTPLVFLLIYFFINQSAFSQDNTRHEMNEHIVYYNVFNSSFITPEVAKIHGLTRAKEQVYLNIAVVKKTGGNGIPAIIEAHSRNLMQQQRDLNIIEIKEATATYYLAPIRFNNEDILHIDVKATLKDGTDSASFTITKKLYKD